jgi:putative endonuclease
MPTRSDLGRRGEDLAAEFLTRRGWRVVARNVRSREGEIDIVASREGIVAFVEVKTRRTVAFGSPAEAVTFRKRLRIRGLAARFLAASEAHAREIRFDVVEVVCRRDETRINHIEAAF